MAGQTSAFTSKSLHDFFPYPAGTATVSGLVKTQDGSFYGIAAAGGLYGHGAVYKVTPDGTYTVVYSFAATDGNPNGPLVLCSDGKLYGLTGKGGPFSPAILYSISNDGAFHKIQTFSDTGTVRASMYGLVSSGNLLYGVSIDGVIYKCTLAGTVTPIHTLDSATEGRSPQQMVVGPDGYLYTVTAYGGINGVGAILRISPSGIATILHSFTVAEAGSLPTPLCVGPDRNLWGAFEYGGASGRGVIYRISYTGRFSIVTSNVGNTGWDISGPLVTKGDSVYGEVRYSPGGFGRILKISAQGVLTTVATLSGQPESGPTGGLTVGNDNNLYGVSFDTQSAALGIVATVFNVNTDGSIKVLHALPVTEGYGPTKLVGAVDGNLYGITLRGGAYDLGTLYKTDPSGAITKIYDFGTVDRLPTSLIVGPDLNLYGVTQNTIFKAIPGAKPTTIYSFVNQAAYGRLTLGVDGWMYGVVFGGGALGFGGVYRINTKGSFELRCSFPSVQFVNEVTLAPNGNIYGLEMYGPHDKGAIFKVQPDGTFSFAYEFPIYTAPLSSLTLAPDGQFYGIARYGFQGLFAFNPSTSTVSIVHAFDGVGEGSMGDSFLTLGPDSKLYGTTDSDNGSGIVYSYNPATHLFVRLGASPPLDKAINNNVDVTLSLSFSKARKLYGVAPGGGVHNSGELFVVE